MPAANLTRSALAELHLLDILARDIRGERLDAGDLATLQEAVDLIADGARPGDCTNCLGTGATPFGSCGVCAEQ